MAKQLVLQPVVSLYKGATPEGVQGAISNAANNLSEPITAGASLPQGDTKNSGSATKQSLFNATIGLGGTQDEATERGIEARQEDLGQAMAKHGVSRLDRILFSPFSARAIFAMRPVPSRYHSQIHYL